ncbi:UPF0182 family protein [Ferrimicrobium sp.]|uniref:UPF0182 family membrane protein n=1 Tax=Ferrimicrobium sp. TaxID=2926050 RepID=UPI00260892E8|nr:UPF0182 family protein [Ferrimicrobium sp.]
MRVPQDIARNRRGPSKAQLVLIGVVVVVIVALFSLKGIAVFYTDYLWFSNYHLDEIWRGVLLAKVELWIVFAAIFAVGCYVSLTLVNHHLPTITEQDDDLIQRYRATNDKHPKLAKIVVTAVATLIVASQAPSEWKNWLLFKNYVAFPSKDPQFHMNAGFFVFRLPFIEFLVSWSFLAVAVIFILTVAIAYLNGSLRLQGRGTRATPHLKAHMSVLLAVMALIKAVGYYFQRYQLDMSTRGYVEGASYTDVHAQLPAINLLIFISIVACGLFVFNIYRQGWVLPVLALGLWAFISIVLGAIYPALIEKFSVAPAQEQKEAPYIARNIVATRYAMGLNSIASHPYNAQSNTSSSVALTNQNALRSIILWGATQPLQTFDKLQDIRSYFQFNSLSIETYKVHGVTTPVVVGVRQINSSNLPAQSWVNQHLQFTHGYGAALAEANTVANSGNPIFDIGNLPPISKGGVPTLKQPQVYYGEDMSGYVIANTKQPEIDYQLRSGASVETHYHSTGGVQLSSIIKRAAFALRFGDINILVSSLLTPQSRIMFERGIVQRAEMAMPFLKYGSHPYPVIANGRIYWVLNGYTTSSNYPYAQAANTSAVPSGSQLATGNYNYIRNSVKVVIDAYSGAMHFYVSDPSDPMIQAYEKAFPNIFQPLSSMNPAIQSHLRYPSDLLSVQSEMYGLYHVTSASNFYSAGNAWQVSASPAIGQIPSGTSGGFASLSSSNNSPMLPVYEMLQLPGSKNPSLSLVEAYVPYSPSGSTQNLTGFLVGQSTPSNPYQLTTLITPNGEQIDGPNQITSRMTSQTAVSQELTLLDQHGSNVDFGSTSAIPLGQNLLWVTPLYVSSTSNPIPEIKEIVAAYGTNIAISPTIAGDLQQIFGVVPSGVEGSLKVATSVPNTVVSSQASSIIAKAQSLYKKAQAALKSGNLALYQQDIDQIGSLLNEISTKVKPSTAKG